MQLEEMQDFAGRYTTAWCSHDARNVASFSMARRPKAGAPSLMVSELSGENIGSDNLIAASFGKFDAAEYERQLRSCQNAI